VSPITQVLNYHSACFDNDLPSTFSLHYTDSTGLASGKPSGMLQQCPAVSSGMDHHDNDDNNDED